MRLGGQLCILDKKSKSYKMYKKPPLSKDIDTDMR